jgi:hypothetical protein
VPVSGVVVIGEYAKVLPVPLADAVGPRVQIGFAVRASVEVIMVRAVEPPSTVVEVARRTEAKMP